MGPLGLSVADTRLTMTVPSFEVILEHGHKIIDLARIQPTGFDTLTTLLVALLGPQVKTHQFVLETRFKPMFGESF